MRISIVVVTALVAGCLPRPEPAQPVAQPYAPQPYPPPQPYPQAQQPTQPPQQPYPPPQQQPAPQPYAPQPMMQPAPYPQPSPYTYPAPTAQAMPVTESRSHAHDGEVIGDFAAVGSLAAIDLMVRQDVTNGSAGTFILLAGLAGGGGLGWLLTEKYPVDAGAAHATTLGLAVGVANGALLIEPTKWDDSDQVLALLLVGSAAGAVGGFVYGQNAHLTPGQAYFIANTTLLGSATAAFGAIIGSRDGRFGGFEDGTLAIGLDGGVVAGAVIAPSLDWSARRAKVVMASTAVGAMVGGMLAGLTTKPKDGSSGDANGDLVAACMTAGMWGGFGLGIVMTKDDMPDPRASQPTRTAAGTATTFAPWLGRDGQRGVMAGGSF